MSGEDGLDLADAEAIANREALERNRAFTQGFYRDTLKGAFQAALDGNLSDFFSNWLKDSMFNALEDVLNRLADSLADLFSKQQGGSGGGGLLGSIGAILGGVFGGGGGGGSFGGGVSVGAARGMSADVYSGFIPGFNTGGSFTFQGLPGIDRNILSLNGSPIARVSKGEVANIQRSGGAGARSQVEVIPSPYFDVRVREVAAPLASQAAQGAVQASEERSMKRQRRSLG